MDNNYLNNSKTENYTVSQMLNMIENAKSASLKKFEVCSYAARKLVEAYNAYVQFDMKKRDNAKDADTLEKMKTAYLKALKEYNDLYAEYNDSVEKVRSNYLFMLKKLSGTRDESRIELSLRDYESYAQKQKEKLLRVVKDKCGLFRESKDKVSESMRYGDINSRAYESEAMSDRRYYDDDRQKTKYGEYINNEQSSPSREPLRNNQRVDIEPVRIDISAIVQRAVEDALDKFGVLLERKSQQLLSEYTAKESQKVSERTEENGASSSQTQESELESSIKMAESVVSEQSNLIEKIKENMQTLDALSRCMIDIGAKLMELSNKQTDSLEMQKNISDMQRTLAREIAGLQVKQRLINKEQGDVYEEQAVVIEHQKSNIERQRILSQSQAGVADMQKTVNESHLLIEESMKELMNSQKQIVTAQQQIMLANRKNMDMQNSLIAKQEEIQALQKEAFSSNKKLLRSQKVLNDKLKSDKDEVKKTAAEISDEVELEDMLVEK